MSLYEKYGEFDSAEELNQKAVELMNDVEALKVLAKENGIDEEDCEDFADGIIDELATPLSAALGKLKAESEDLKISGVLDDWLQELQAECTNSVEMQRAVRKKGKSLAKFIALLADDGYTNRAVVSKKVVEQCCSDIKKIIGSHEFSIGVPNKATRKNIMYSYYMGK